MSDTPLITSTLALKEHHCRWPIGDPKRPGFGYCGRPRLEGSPYCARHHDQAYMTPPQRQRTVKAA